MATIRPFRGLRYSSVAGDISNLVAPPYDVLSPEERDRFAAKNAHNVVWLTLPESASDDRSKYVKYACSASRLQEWRQSGALALEARPSFYRYRQRFEIPGHPGRLYDRLSLIACIKVEPYDRGVVLPHEQTFPKHKEDRLRLLEATRSHLECIYGLYDDDDQQVLRLIHGAPGEAASSVQTDDGVQHVLERIDDVEATGLIAAALADKKVWIADGHHRYETAMNFRAALGERAGEVPEDFMMMALSSMADPGLVLLPTHRILDKVEHSPEEIRRRVEPAFCSRPCANGELEGAIEAVSKAGGRAFGLALPGGEGLVLEVGDLDAVSAEGEGSELLRALDVSILHNFIFRRLLDLSGFEFFSYTRNPEEAVQAVERGAKASFLMNPPTVDDMRHIALGGEKMPQKSTFYYPKILSGLVMWSLADAGP